MKKYCVIFLICLFAGLFSSCKSVTTFKTQDLNGRWTIVSVQNEPVVLQNLPFLEFDTIEKKVSGNAGCNVLSSRFETDSKNASAIKFLESVTTMKACIEGMETEAKILQAINAVTNVKKGDNPNQVKLLDKTGNTMIVLSQP
jgi:heat shock protein HslJ